MAQVRWLPVIEQTESLTAIDVNTGRYVGRKSQETVLRTNLEAAKQVVAQLRLRNLGGIIVIDFIDMEEAANRKRVFEALQEAMREDKARTNILRISELGLVEMTRKRTRESLGQLLTSPCPHCQGSGRVRSVETRARRAPARPARGHAATRPRGALPRVHPRGRGLPGSGRSAQPRVARGVHRPPRHRRRRTS
jgi:ribonuclease G